MNKIYCLHCNFGSSYESSKPTYCQKCGKPYIDTTNASVPKVALPRIKSRHIEEIEEEIYDEEIIETPQIESFEVEIQGNLRGNRENLGQLKGQGKLGLEKTKIKVKPLTQKQLEKKFESRFTQANRKNPVDIG